MSILRVAWFVFRAARFLRWEVGWDFSGKQWGYMGEKKDIGYWILDIGYWTMDDGRLRRAKGPEAGERKGTGAVQGGATLAGVGPDAMAAEHVC